MGKFDNIKERTLYGSLAAVVTISCTLVGGFPFIIMLLLATYVMAQEWDRLTTTFEAKWRWIGATYIILPILCMLYLRLDMSFFASKFLPTGLTSHLIPTLFLFATVWTTDTAAYFAGKFLGKRPLAPEISPGKTWEGLIGAILATALLYIIASATGVFHVSLLWSAIFGAFLAIISQSGDLFESAIKRRADVKDSGTFLPGHGGMLDRVDGLLFAAPAFTFLWVLI